MQWIGIDLHKKHSRYVVVDQEGKTVHKRTIASTPESFRGEFDVYDSREVTVVLEATINWYWAVDTLQNMGFDVHLANPRKVRLIAESTIKTDTVDATALAHLLRMNWLPESRITPRPMRDLRERLRYRITLVRLGSSIKCRVRALLGKRGVETPSFSDLFGKAGREWLSQVALPAEYRANLNGYLRTLDHLREEIKQVERWLATSTHTDRDITLLTSIPGIGRFGAALILAEVGDIGFFRTKRKLSSFVGVVPGARNSDEHSRDTALKKDSNRYMRWLLAEACTKAIRVVPAWQRLYDRVRAGSDKRRAKARVAVMHKMVCAIWRVLATKEGFNRLHNCPELTATTASSPLGAGLKQGR